MGNTCLDPYNVILDDNTEYEYIKTEDEISRESRIIHNLSEGEYLLRRVEGWAVFLRNELLDIISSYPAFADSLKDIGDNFKMDIRDFERELFGLKIIYEKPALIIHVPSIVPHKKSRPDILYEKTFFDYLIEFKKTADFKEFYESIRDNALIIFKHSYKGRSMVRDNDNIETKRIIDLLVEADFLKEDNGTYLSKYLTAEELDSEKSFTTIYILPKSECGDFMEKNDLW